MAKRKNTPQLFASTKLSFHGDNKSKTWKAKTYPQDMPVHMWCLIYQWKFICRSTVVHAGPTLSKTWFTWLFQRGTDVCPDPLEGACIFPLGNQKQLLLPLRAILKPAEAVSRCVLPPWAFESPPEQLRSPLEGLKGWILLIWLSMTFGISRTSKNWSSMDIKASLVLPPIPV